MQKQVAHTYKYVVLDACNPPLSPSLVRHIGLLMHGYRRLLEHALEQVSCDEKWIFATQTRTHALLQAVCMLSQEGEPLG